MNNHRPSNLDTDLPDPDENEYIDPNSFRAMPRKRQEQVLKKFSRRYGMAFMSMKWFLDINVHDIDDDEIVQIAWGNAKSENGCFWCGSEHVQWHDSLDYLICYSCEGIQP